MVKLRLTAEHQAILRAACRGMYLTNGATDQRLASQQGCYGGFYQAFWAIIKQQFSEEVFERMLGWDGLNISEDPIPQIVDFFNYCDDHELILL